MELARFTLFGIELEEQAVAALLWRELAKLVVIVSQRELHVHAAGYCAAGKQAGVSPLEGLRSALHQRGI